MPAPPSDMTPDEQLLDADQLAQLDCLSIERRRLVTSRGGDLDSEKGSHSEKFGYIFRYDVSKTMADDSGKLFTVTSMIVFWTSDCKMLSMATYPGLVLPQADSRLQ